MNPYNYDGIGYDGAPSQPSPSIVSFDLIAGEPALDFAKGDAVVVMDADLQDAPAVAFEMLAGPKDSTWSIQ